jgi:chromosome segregation ATPase
MANKNKNINELVTDDNDTTAELEVLVLDKAKARTDAELESDANTHDYLVADGDAGDGGGDETISELKSDLQNRSKTIDSLQFDIEQLRAKWLGLETEIGAREELAQRLNRELADARKLQEQAESKLKKRNQSIKSLKAEIRERDGEYRSLAAANAELQTKVDHAATAVQDLDKALLESKAKVTDLSSQLQQIGDQQKTANDNGEKAQKESAGIKLSLDDARQTIAELQQYIDQRHSEWEPLHNRLAELESASNNASTERDSVQAEHSRIQTEIEQLRTTQSKRDETIWQLKDEIKALKQRARNARDKDDSDKLRQTLSEQAGQLASNEMMIRDLQNQVERTESYADTMRRQLQELTLESTTSTDTRDSLQIALDSALQQNSELLDFLEIERQSVSDLKKNLLETEKAHALEVRTIRFELGEAEETLAQSEIVSEQLVSDLVDTREFKNELEIMLNEKSEQSQREIDELSKKNRKLEREIAAYEQKLTTKSEAVTFLIAELAKKDQQMDSIDQIEEVIHEIDNRMSERIDELPASDRERVTRVLIGTFDGQELRFPLFKNRLTIGRTQTNDIQLEAAHISRRHAVIVTDGNATRIIDWGSKNGVSVNNKRVTEHFLRNGDVVTIGTADFKYEERPKRDS